MEHFSEQSIVLENSCRSYHCCEKSEVIRLMREAVTAFHDKGTAMDMMTKIIARAALTMSNFMNKLIRHHLIEKIKPDDELFCRVLSDSRKVKDKNLIRSR